ncbi:uroporphyrinogen-III synthase [Devosia sp.]|uniref:uroporphyrinogen-III synthase n=1 Tax=Devosia sp. TaxID=1871048 RepID=UPI0026285712|nr:uroporphyrinogen-III synthase [Devosia sp.]
MRMLVTRPEPDGQATVQRLAALAIQAIAAPLMSRRTLDISLPPANGFAALALTSTNGLRALEDRGVIAQFSHLPVFAVGGRTALEARSMGFAEAFAAGGTLGDLVNLMARARLAGPVFYPAGKHLSGDLAKALAQFGVMVVTARVYDMVPVEALPDAIVSGLASGDIGGVLLYSRRTAELLVKALEGQLDRAQRSRIAMLCLSEAVAEPLMAAHFNRISLADHPSDESMMALALAVTREQNRP